MSLATWIAEFYPTPASLFANRDVTTESKREAVEHSLRKWRGALIENTSRHDVALEGRFLLERDGSRYLFSGGNCSLCALFTSPHTESLDCSSCPLAQARNRVPCDAPRYVDGEREPDPFSARNHKGEPVQMIHYLEKALELVNSEAAESAEPNQAKP